MRHARYAVLLAATAGVYVGAAKVGIGLDVAHGVITPVWAPTGIALAALLLFGLRLWPAVAAGALIANATSGLSIELAAGIAVGNTLEAVAGTWLLNRIGFHRSLDRVRDVLAFVVIAALGATTLSATNGVTILEASGELANGYGREWLLWWFGDAAGAMLVAPLLLAWATRRRARPSRAQLGEAVLLFSGLIALSVVVFLLGGWRYPYLLFPFLLWAPFRFRQIGAATSAFVVGAFATAGVVAGEVPIADSSTEGVQVLQALICVVGVTLLFVAATLSERNDASAALEQAQELTHIGSWEWDIAANRVTWSDELYRIYGLAPQSEAVDYERYIELVHPADRERVHEHVQRAFRERGAFTFEHRIVLPDGTERLLHARGRVETDESGTPVRMVGTGQDVTHQRQVDDLRNAILATVSHELRTPLTAVLGFAVTLQERRHQLSEAELEQVVGHLVEQAERLDVLLTNLLDIDRYRRGVVEPRRVPTDLLRLVEHAVDEHRDGSRVISVDADSVVADVDPPMVERIVDNLIANAVKHTDPGARIAITLRHEDGDVLLVVSDDGPGVAAEDRAAVFELFRRSRTASADAVPPGAGVGLAIVAQFAALHGGRAWVEDAPAGGAAFHVLLPDCVRAGLASSLAVP